MKKIFFSFAVCLVFIMSCKKNEDMISSNSFSLDKKPIVKSNQQTSSSNLISFFVNADYSVSPAGPRLSITVNNPDMYIWDITTYTYFLDGEVIGVTENTTFSSTMSLTPGAHTVKVVSNHGGQGQYTFMVHANGTSTQINEPQGPFNYTVFGYISYITDNMPSLRVQWNYSTVQHQAYETDIYIEVVAIKAHGLATMFSKTVPTSVGYIDVNLMGENSPQITYGDKLVLSVYNSKGRLGTPKVLYSNWVYGTNTSSHGLVEYYRLGFTNTQSSFYDSSLYYNEIVN